MKAFAEDQSGSGTKISQISKIVNMYIQKVSWQYESEPGRSL